MFHQMKKLLVQVMTPSSKRSEGPYVYGWNMQHRKVCQSVVLWSGRRPCRYITTVPRDGGKKGIFYTSRGWFEDLKKQIRLYNVKKTGESSSADSVAGPEYAEHFKMIRALVTTTNLSP